MRILDEQWQKLSRAVGNVFLPILAEILPYLNAILMVLTEIIGAFATFLGFDIGEFDYFESASESAWDLDDALGSANDSAKKLKQGLRGFDKLNVITTPTQARAGGGVGSGIDPKLMEAFNKSFDDYNSKLEDVSMRATKIRDAIMDWLGFTKEIDPLTGKVSWKYEGIQKTFENIWESFKNLSTEGKILTGLALGTWFINIWKGAKKLLGVLGSTGLGKWVGKVATEFKKMFDYSKVYKSLTGNWIDGFLGGVDSWKKRASFSEKLRVGISGIITASGGLYLVKDAIEDIDESGFKLKNTLELIGGSLSTIVGGAQIGASIGGGKGAIIGGIAGGVVALGTALASYKTETEKSAEATEKALDPLNKYNQSLEEQLEQIEKNNQQQSITTGVHEALLDELGKIVDENGKVKSGYEERAKFITTTLSQAYGIELEISDGIIKNYQKQVKEIKKLIDKKKQEIAINLATEKYEWALKNQTEAYQNLNKAQELHNIAVSEVEEKEEELKKRWDEGTESMHNLYGSFENYQKTMAENDKGYKSLLQAEKKTKEALEESQDSYDKTQKAILTYNGIIEASANDNAKEIEKYTAKLLSSHDKEKNSYKSLIGEAKTSYDTIIELAKTNGAKVEKYTDKHGKEMLKITDKNGKDITAKVLSQANQRYRENAIILANEVTSVEDITPDYVDAWGNLAKESEDIFLEYFQELPEDVQQEVVDKMYDRGFEISDELQRGITENTPSVKINYDEVEKTDDFYDKGYNLAESIRKGLQKGLNKKISPIKIDVDTKNVNSTLKKLFSGLNGQFSILKNIGINIPSFDINAFANGGMPQKGQLFFMNEKTPELMGNIGGQTFIANQNQMMDLLDRKIGNAQNNSGTEIFNIYLDKDNKLATYTLNKVQKMARNNGEPITIGG